jgi:osmotically-inducible protein OsmY
MQPAARSGAARKFGTCFDDAAITAAFAARLFDDEDVAPTSIHVEALSGAAIPCGFANTGVQWSSAEVAARKVNGVKAS